MLFFLVSCLSFLFLSQSFLKPNPISTLETRLWAFLETLHRYFLSLSRKRKTCTRVFHFPSIKKLLSSRFDVLEEKDEVSLLDLPDLALDCILEKLLPSDLFTIAKVCSPLREKCTSDHFWEKHLEQKWGGVIGDSAYREWKYQNATKRALKFLSVTAHKNKYYFFSCPLEFFGFKTEMKEDKRVNSVMSFYLSLEAGKFWFPAQVFNRENGHIGFMLSCFDARLCYDSTTDNFVARYPAQGRSLIEENVEWNRIRAPSVETPANVLHNSDCLNELKPDDHIEVQWRKNQDFPYGWWYGVVGHLESCGRNEFNCWCHISDTVVLEFKQYSPGSRWRKTMISRKDHREVGNEADGFYGGIRKLNKKEEIEKWNQLWPDCTLE